MLHPVNNWQKGAQAKNFKITIIYLKISNNNINRQASTVQTFLCVSDCSGFIFFYKVENIV